MLSLSSSINYAVSNFVPYGDKLINRNQNSPRSPVSKRAELSRIGTAKRIKSDMESGRVFTFENPDAIAGNMKSRAASRLSERNKLIRSESRHYHLDQLPKIGSLADWIIPGTGIVSEVVSHSGKIANIYNSARQSSISTKETLKRIGEVATAVAITITTTMALNYVKSHLPF